MSNSKFSSMKSERSKLNQNESILNASQSNGTLIESQKISKSSSEDSKRSGLSPKISSVDVNKKRNTLSQFSTKSFNKLQNKNVLMHHLNSLSNNKVPLLNFSNLKNKMNNSESKVLFYLIFIRSWKEKHYKLTVIFYNNLSEKENV